MPRAESIPHFGQGEQFGVYVDRGWIFRLPAAGFLNRLFKPLQRLLAQGVPNRFVGRSEINRTLFFEQLREVLLPFGDRDLMNFYLTVARLASDLVPGP